MSRNIVLLDERPAAPKTLLDDLDGVPSGVAALARQAMAVSAAEATERRARVLRHPDLAAKLTEPPLSYKRPEQWNGYVPPKLWDGPRKGILNDSPRRQALVDICHEALRREHEAPAE